MRTSEKAAGIGHNSQKETPKSDAGRSKDSYYKKRDAGWRMRWVDPDTLRLADMFGGIENISTQRDEDQAAYAELGSKLHEAEMKIAELEGRSLWSRLLNRKS